MDGRITGNYDSQTSEFWQNSEVLMLKNANRLLSQAAHMWLG
jgi:hypothetical protein